MYRNISENSAVSQEQGSVVTINHFFPPTNWKVYLLSIAQSISLEIYIFISVDCHLPLFSFNKMFACLAFLHWCISLQSKQFKAINSTPQSKLRKEKRKKSDSHSFCFQIFFSKDYIKYSSNKSRIFMSATYFTLVYASFLHIYVTRMSYNSNRWAFLHASSIVCGSYIRSIRWNNCKEEARVKRCNGNKRIWISVSGNLSVSTNWYMHGRCWLFSQRVRFAGADETRKMNFSTQTTWWEQQSH